MLRAYQLLDILFKDSIGIAIEKYRVEVERLNHDKSKSMVQENYSQVVIRKILA